ncbi:unnamed protein product, partial [Effrenium voratum]
DLLRLICGSRRTLLGLRRSFLLWWDRTRHRDFWNSAWPTLQRLLRNLHRCQAGPAPVLQLHVPKTAGSALKSWAETQGFQVRGQENQNWAGDGPYWIGSRAIPATCGQRRLELDDNGTTWFSVERWLDLPLCEDFQYVVALRDPVPRVLHQFQHKFLYFRLALGEAIAEALRQRQAEDLPQRLWSLFRYEELRHKLRQRRAARRPLLWRNASAIGQGGPDTWHVDWLELWLGMASNYQVRSLAGAGGGLAYLEDGGAGARLAAAKAVLEQFDVILPVSGRHGLDASDQELLRLALQLPQKEESGGFPFISHRNFGDEKLQPFRVNPVNLSASLAAELRSRNWADRMLVHHARRLRRLDRIYFRTVAQDL